MSLIATVLTVGAMITDGLWLLLALGPYFLAYLAYRGTIAAADHYGSAVTTIIHVDPVPAVPAPRARQAHRRRPGTGHQLTALALLKGTHEDLPYEPPRPPGLVDRLLRRRG